MIDHQVFGLGRVLQSSANVLTIKLSGGTDLSLNRQEHAGKFMSVLARSLQEAQEYVTLAPTRPQLLQRVVLDGRSKSGESASASPDGVTFLGGTTFTLKSKASDSRSKRSKDSSQAWCPRCGLSVEKKDFKKHLSNVHLLKRIKSKKRKRQPRVRLQDSLQGLRRKASGSSSAVQGGLCNGR